MTKREYYAQIREIVAENEELVAFVDHEVELLDKKNSRKSNKPTKTQVENEGIKAQIAEVLGAEPQTASQIAEAVGYSTAKVASLLKQMENVTKTPAKGKNPTTYSIG